MGTKCEMLQSFYYFNSDYMTREGQEEKKILYYYPNDSSMDTKIKNVGLSEAIIKFTDSFNPSTPCESLHTQKSRHIFHEAEPGFWSVITISVPSVTKIKDGQEHVEYVNEDVNDSIYLAVLKHCHQMFQLFNGHLSQHYNSPDVIKRLLEQFYSRFLPTLKLQHADLLDIFAGMQFLPLEAINFLHVQCLINKVETSFPTVKYSAVLFHDQLVWSGIDPQDMQLIFTFLVTNVLSYVDTENIEDSRQQQLGQYIIGLSTGTRSALWPSSLPKIYLSNGEVVYLVVYRSMNATIALLVDSVSAPTPEFFQRFNTFVSSRLSNISEELAMSCAKAQSTAVPTSLNNSFTTDIPKYIYFNNLNKATKSTVHLDSRKCGNISISQEQMKLLADVSCDKEGLHACSEVILKTRNDSWVAGKFANLREFYVVLNTKNANLIEISDEVGRLCERRLSCIFLVD